MTTTSTIRHLFFNENIGKKELRRTHGFTAVQVNNALKRSISPEERAQLNEEASA